MVDDIVDAVRERILNGELPPGVKIRQEELAARLGVSRTPLREAFQRLEAGGWVHLRARRGAEVRSLTVADAEEIFTMRVVLETVAARLVATAHDDDAEARAREIVAAELTAADAEGGAHGANDAFHEIVYGLRSAHLPRELASAVSGYWTRALRYRLVYRRRPASAGRSHHAHEAILDAWSRRDPDATERAVADHILTALWEITARIDPTRAPSPALQALAERYHVALPTIPTPETS